MKKLVLILLAAAAHRETHRAWLSVQTLATDSDSDDRSVRKALKDLQEGGYLADTGARVGRQKNVTVWSFPLFEASLNSNPDKNVGVQGSDASGTLQVADLTSGNDQSSTDDPQPSQKCQGSEDRTPTLLHPNPDKNAVRTLPKTSGESSDLNPVRNPKDAPARATPSGSRGAKSESEPEYNTDDRRRFWRSRGLGHVRSECVALGIVAYGAAPRFDDLPTAVRLVMVDKIDALVAWAVSQERPPAVKGFNVIANHIEHELTLELRAFKPSTPAEIASGRAA